MLKVFINDTDIVKKRALFYICFGVLLFVINYFVISIALDVARENQHQSTIYKQQSEWLGNFNKQELESLHKSILKPVAINEVSRIQGEQLQILEENLLEVESVRNDSFKEQMEKKKSQVKAVKTSLVAKGSWENIVAALNAFEKKNLVVITGVDLERVADQLVMKMEYQTYYL